METVLQLKVGYNAMSIISLQHQSDYCSWCVVYINLTHLLQPDLQEAKNEIAEVRVLVLQRKQQPGAANKRIRTS